MKATETVNEGATRQSTPVISLRYPAWKRKLVESIQHRRADPHLSDTVAYALDRLLEEHGLLEAA